MVKHILANAAVPVSSPPAAFGGVCFRSFGLWAADQPQGGWGGGGGRRDKREERERGKEEEKEKKSFASLTQRCSLYDWAPIPGGQSPSTSSNDPFSFNGNVEAKLALVAPLPTLI